jgi:hypothetical protein
LALSLAPVSQGQDTVTCDNDVVVQANDWLSKIADKFFGDVLAYTVIAEATNTKATTDDSYATIADVNLIEPGWKLCIPTAEYAQSMLGMDSQPEAAMESSTEAESDTEMAAESDAAMTDWVAPEGALVSVPVTQAPTLDGTVDEAFWADAPAITVQVRSGANMGESDVTLQSAYDDTNVYFTVSWADPTQSFTRSPWVKQEDGSWRKLTDPDDKGGDNNVYYEDKMAIIWSINDSIPDFENIGCFTACHAGENSDAKPYGNKNTDEAGQLGDIWHWKSVRNLNQVDDQYLDSTPYSPDTPSAGRHGDPKDGGGYVNNQNEDNSLPMYMGPADAPRDGSPGYILDSEKIPFEDELFAAGDMIPGIFKSQFTGDRGDISAGWKYEDGVWTVEIARALVTGSDYDVQFSDLTAAYPFGVAVFDNAQVRHAYQRGAETLVFKP